MEISEKVAYLKGLAEGLKLDEETCEGKLIAAIIDVLDAMAEEFADVESEIVDLEDGLDAVSEDLSDVEETLYFALDEDEDDEDDDDELFVTTCPCCEEEVVFDEDVPTARWSAPTAASVWSSTSATWPTPPTATRSNPSASNHKKRPERGAFSMLRLREIVV